MNEAWQTGDVAGIVADLRADHLDSEGSVDFPGRRSLTTHARIRGYSMMQAIILSPARGEQGRRDDTETLRLLTAIAEAVRTLVDEHHATRALA